MQPFVLSSPPVGAPTEVTNWRGLGITWEGPDGQTWDLTDRAGGILLTGQGVEGLHDPRITKYGSSSPGIPGKRSRGWRAEPRDVFWPLFVWADGSDAWRNRALEFFASIHPENAGTWRVKAGADERLLRLTGVYDSPHRYAYDPLLTGWQTFAVALEADQPFWEGEPVQRGPWASPAPSEFFPPAGGPPLTISSSSTFGNAVVPNPGNVESFGRWTAVGPLQNIVLGVGPAWNTIPFSLEGGRTLVIDTDPRHPSALLDGVDVTARMGLQQWSAVPPGSEIPLHVAATGEGSVAFHHTPLFFRAF